MNTLINTCILAAAALLAPAVLAQSPVPASPVTSTLVAHRVDTVNGKQVLAPAEAGKPGDLLEYSGTYRNGGAKPVDKLVATVPIPTGTSFVAGSMTPAGAQASTDGSRFAAIPLTRAVRQPDGSTRQEPVPLADYRYVRWELGTLDAGASSTVKVRVQINAAAPVAAAAAAKP